MSKQYVVETFTDKKLDKALLADAVKITVPKTYGSMHIVVTECGKIYLESADGNGNVLNKKLIKPEEHCHPPCEQTHDLGGSD